MRPSNTRRPEPAPFASIFFFLCFLPIAALAGEPPAELEPVVVTASHIVTQLPAITRQVEVIEREDILSASADSVSELLRELSLVDVRQRGPDGVQTDLSVRGSTFNQVLVLVDGQRMRDPQTGHHTMDLPVPLSSIDRIEVLRGAGSSLYGPDAFGGVINIITRKPEAGEGFLASEAGDFGTWHTALACAHGWQSWGTQFAAERRWSAGHRPNTDYDITIFSWKLSADSPRGPLDLSVGAAEKDFGADGFFAPFPSREETRTLWLSAGGDLDIGSNSTLSPQLSYRRHWDDFVLDRTRPAWYVNHHVTDLYEAALRPVVALGDLGDLALLAEWAEERIDSSALGDHADTRWAGGIEHRFPAPALTTFVWGLRLDDHSQYGTEVSPSAGLAYTVIPGLKLTASVNRAFRAPTFTERYYADPANIGNPQLRAETAWAYEAGASFIPSEEMAIHITLFRRDAKDLIDWVRAIETEPWRATNIGKVRTEGIELRISLQPQPTIRFMLDYAFLNLDRHRSPLLSKYAHRFAPHDVTLRFQAPLPWGARQQWVGRYTYRKALDRRFLLGCRFSREIGRLAVFVEAKNLLGEAYEDVPGVPMPGRYVGGGISLRW